MTATQEVRELAAKSAAELRRRGWFSGLLFDFGGPGTLSDCKVCALGATLAATEDYSALYYRFQSPGPLQDLAVEFAKRVAPIFGGEVPDPRYAYEFVYRFNDNFANSVNDVLAVFDAIAAGE